MNTTVLHITDASSSGVLAAVTTIARSQARLPGCEITFAYVPRHDSPSRERIQEMTGPHVHVEQWSRSVRAAVPALAVRTLIELMRRRSGIIHVHSSRAGLLGRGAALLTGHRSRTVYSPHSFAFDRSDAPSYTRAVLIALERFGTMLGPRHLLVSSSEEELTRRVLRRARTTVLSNRVDAAALAAVRAAAMETGGALRVVHVGRIAPQKRPAQFAAIARRWRVEQAQGLVPEATFHWLGEGDRALLGDAPVEVSGWLDRPALHAALAAADLVLYTSAGEGMPLALLEAQGMGIPVIGHEVTGMADVVIDGHTGILRSSSADLYDALHSLARDVDQRHTLGHAARARVQEHFDLADLAADSFAAYRELGIDHAAHLDPPAARSRITMP